MIIIFSLTHFMFVFVELVVSTKNAELNEFFKCTCEELFNVFNTAEVSVFLKKQQLYSQ